MKRLSIAAKIWLSIGVFVAGFVFSNTLEQLQGRSTERDLRVASADLFPAAQKSQEADAAFQRAVKSFSDAVVTQDASAVDHGAEDGQGCGIADQSNRRHCESAAGERGRVQETGFDDCIVRLRREDGLRNHGGQSRQHDAGDAGADSRSGVADGRYQEVAAGNQGLVLALFAGQAN